MVAGRPAAIPLVVAMMVRPYAITGGAEDLAAKDPFEPAIDTGSAGPGNFAGFRKHVIEPSQVRILAYLHVSHAGIYAFSDRVMVGESEELRLMDPELNTVASHLLPPRIIPPPRAWRSAAADRAIAADLERLPALPGHEDHRPRPAGPRSEAL